MQTPHKNIVKKNLITLKVFNIITIKILSKACKDNQVPNNNKSSLLPNKHSHFLVFTFSFAKTKNK